MAFFLLACTKNDTPLQTLTRQIQSRIREFPGKSVAVAYEDLQNGRTLLIDAKEMMHAASTMKVPVMIEVFRQAEAGRFLLSDSVVVRNEFRSIVDGSVYSMDIGEDSDDRIYRHIGQKMSIYDLTQEMITMSSNLATNLLIQLVGAEQVMSTMKALGAKDIRILRGVEDLKAYHAGLNNRTDAFDLMLIMEAIAKHKLVSSSACDEMLAILAGQKFNTKIPALLPQGARVAHKTGSITRINHDCAIVYPPDAPPFVLVVLTKGFANHRESDRLIAEISRTVYESHVQEHLLGGGANSN